MLQSCIYEHDSRAEMVQILDQRTLEMEGKGNPCPWSASLGRSSCELQLQETEPPSQRLSKDQRVEQA